LAQNKILLFPHWSNACPGQVSPKTGCLDNFSYHGHCHWFEMPIISQALNPPGESIDRKLPLEGAICQAAPLP
jgi:hypothetical protein